MGRKNTVALSRKRLYTDDFPIDEVVVTANKLGRFFLSEITPTQLIALSQGGPHLVSPAR
jgi:hypothetical protein